MIACPTVPVAPVTSVVTRAALADAASPRERADAVREHDEPGATRAGDAIGGARRSAGSARQSGTH